MWKSIMGRGWFGAAKRLAPVAVIVLILTACGDPTQSEEYTSLQSEYAALQLQLDAALGERDEVVVRLTGTETALADSVQAFDAAEASLAHGEVTIADLRAAVAEMDASMARIRQALAAHASGDLIVGANSYENALASGMTIEISDHIVVSLDLPGGTWEAFNSDENRFWCWCEQVNGLDDPELSAALDRWFDTPVGSDEEFWAWYEVQLRILDMTITEIDEGRDIAVSTLSGGSR
jgi:hypothetical protein